MSILLWGKVTVSPGMPRKSPALFLAWLLSSFEACPSLGTRKLAQGANADGLLLLFFRIGRMAGRLPRELADDVVGSVLDCFR